MFPPVNVCAASWLTTANGTILLFVLVAARMGRIAAPIPIPGSISNTSVTLEWKWNSTALGWIHLNPAINVSLKWCYSQPEMCSTWEAVPNATSGRSGQSLMTVNELRPYTSYRVSKPCHHCAVHISQQYGDSFGTQCYAYSSRYVNWAATMASWSIRILTLQLLFVTAFQFRLVIVLASDREPLTSEESAPILTLPSGLPSSPPTNLQAVVLDANRIVITWDPPFYSNGPLVSYSLKIQEASSRNVESYHGSQVKLIAFATTPKCSASYIPVEYTTLII